MDDLDQLLSDYDDVIQRYRALMEKELQHLKETGSLDEDLSDDQRTLIESLTEKLEILRSYRDSNHNIDSTLKQKLDQVQHKFLQVIKLDREVEKQYLERQSAKSGALRSMAQGADRAAARRFYGLS
jgi:hypothetical protein